MSTANAKKYGKVALLMGGLSAEREISLISGKAVLEALRAAGVDVMPIDAGSDIAEVLARSKCDRVFNILHGGIGENGTVQALLDLIGLPYTGSGVLGCALAMDKLRSKWIWKGVGLAVPEYMELRSATDCSVAVRELGLPLMVKPVFEGSSVGISKVERESDMENAWRLAARYGTVIAEKFISGAEYTAGILAGEALPLIRLETPRAFYDYEAKYKDDKTRYHCPCGLSASKEQEMQRIALHAYAALGASGWGRVDFMTDRDGRPWLIEANTAPGMTDHSLVPMAARAAGIDFQALVLRILDTSLDMKRGGVHGA
ncbi:MAG TPA: D-alanine--D-alanine ligase [Gammaproteobacteria bacterium]|nr:D-alanine--D-alanine ligase [Gammaproteobacteria bacterium]